MHGFLSHDRMLLHGHVKEALELDELLVAQDEQELVAGQEFEWDLKAQLAVVDRADYELLECVNFVGRVRVGLQVARGNEFL